MVGYYLVRGGYYLLPTAWCLLPAVAAPVARYWLRGTSHLHLAAYFSCRMPHAACRITNIVGRVRWTNTWGVAGRDTLDFEDQETELLSFRKVPLVSVLARAYQALNPACLRRRRSSLLAAAALQLA